MRNKLYNIVLKKLCTLLVIKVNLLCFFIPIHHFSQIIPFNQIQILDDTSSDFIYTNGNIYIINNLLVDNHLASSYQNTISKKQNNPTNKILNTSNSLFFYNKKRNYIIKKNKVYFLYHQYNFINRLQSNTNFLATQLILDWHFIKYKTTKTIKVKFNSEIILSNINDKEKYLVTNYYSYRGYQPPPYIS